YNIKKVMKIITKKGCEHRSINLNIEDYNISKFTYFYFKKYKLILENTINSVEIELYNLDFYNYFTNNKNKENLSNLDKNIIYLLQSLFFIDACKENNELNNWDFHDSLFHLKSRFGRHNNGYGATYRYKNNDDIPKIMKKINKNTNEILLEKPDKNKLRNKNLNFFDVLEKRFSSRKYSNMPIKINEISDFLFLTSRVKEIKEDYHCEITKRPYPNGGSLYELELYLTILNCRELKNGLYYYNPKKHSLIFINKININTEKMITFAQNASKCKNFHVLITITARFQRVMWKYESISYSLILKNTGVLLQNLSLAATSLNLGSCIIGAGDLDTLSNEIGEKFYNESAVGEIILGKI
ncbi:MAG: SagB family peptide dehydrogenase, partial [Clostridiales bacterium]